MKFVGIDPGKKGGIAAVNEDGHLLCADKLEDLTLADVWGLVIKYCDDPGDAVYLEKVHAISHPRRGKDGKMIMGADGKPELVKQGVTSMFTFGNRFGWLEMGVTAIMCRWEYVRPVKWQMTVMGYTSKGDKKITRAFAQRLFPGAKVTHAVADAMLIAEARRRTWIGIAPAAVCNEEDDSDA